VAQTRRLVAILAADVLGYSRLMGAEEEGTHERPMPFACVSGLTKSCDKNQSFSVIQLKPKPTMGSPSTATQSPKGSCAKQNSGKAIKSGSGQAADAYR
jgi:hypothetical protein